MVEIKSLFTDWHTVTKEQAKKYIQFVYNNITAMNEKQKIEYIEQKRLRGITYKELMNS